MNAEVKFEATGGDGTGSRSSRRLEVNHGNSRLGPGSSDDVGDREL